MVLPEEEIWARRTLAALDDLNPEVGAQLSEIALIEQVAIRFADQFAPSDRAYHANAERPRWHDAVLIALSSLRRQGLIRRRGAPALTRSGRARLAAVSSGLDVDQALKREDDGTSSEEAPLMVAGVIAAPLRTGEARKTIGFTGSQLEPIPVMAEVNLWFSRGVEGAFARLIALWDRATGGRTPGPTRVSDQYLVGELTMREIERLVAADAAPVHWPERSIHRIWPDFPVRLHVDASCVTVKVDAARRTFNAYGAGIVWAVIDSGVWGGHPHFAAHHTLDHADVRDLHRVFPLTGQPTRDGALVDDDGHGTHVAGIIAGAIQPWLLEDPQRSVRATESRYNIEDPRQPLRVPRPIADPSMLAGMAPLARLVSLKVLEAGGTLEARVNRVIRALAYVREINGSAVDGIRIHGVNLSIGYEFDPQWFACGRSPLCSEVDKLVRSGVVVVVAAGNSGFGTLAVRSGAPTRFGLDMTINDPGNTERAITVGSTHRNAPHSYGVSFFSSKGPTGDGRRKPDLVAPGERITSCAAGASLSAVLAGQPEGNTAYYVEDTGTSMAAPHVSGAIAALLSARREFIGRPEDVKNIVVGSATSLGRGVEFQGAGLLDLMRALQTI
jgi:subtilisin family serine protease